MKIKKLKSGFFGRPTLTVAEELVGKILAVKYRNTVLRGRLVEVEAYIGEDDRACHASRGKTPRNAIMYGQPGGVYVYFTYGNHFMLNFVTERDGFPAATLIRAFEPLDGTDIMLKNRGLTELTNIASGPGKLTKAMDITKKHNGMHIEGETINVFNDGHYPPEISVSSRIGIGPEEPVKLWRFFDPESPHISRGDKKVRDSVLSLAAARKKYLELIVA